MITTLAFSSAVNPNRIVPRPMLLTCSPERPRWEYVISPLTAGKRTRDCESGPRIEIGLTVPAFRDARAGALFGYAAHYQSNEG